MNSDISDESIFDIIWSSNEKYIKSGICEGNGCSETAVATFISGYALCYDHAKEFFCDPLHDGSYYTHSKREAALVASAVYQKMKSDE